jgi:hypothetical protein
VRIASAGLDPTRVQTPDRDDGASLDDLRALVRRRSAVEARIDGVVDELAATGAS